MGKSFLQSEEWADFQRQIGRKILQAEGVKIIKHKLPMNKSYLYAPYPDLSQNMSEFVEKIKEIAKKENAIFFKLEPAFAKASAGRLLEDFGFIKSNNIQPIKTIILDISKSEQEILSQMNSKMRYNINLAQKKGIRIRAGHGEKDFNAFWELVQKTGKRDGFRHYSRDYYKKMLEIPRIKLFLAEYPADSGASKVIVANIVVFHNQQAIYLHGASDYKYRNLMAAPLLQWQQILEAKKLGCTEYDFWGIDETKWPGVTRFKKGFSGKEVAYPGAYDLIFQPTWYKIYKFAKKLL